MNNPETSDKEMLDLIAELLSTNQAVIAWSNRDPQAYIYERNVRVLQAVHENLKQLAEIKQFFTDSGCYVLPDGECVSPFTCPHGGPVPFRGFMRIWREFNKGAV